MATAKLFTAGFKTSILPTPTRGMSAISWIIFDNLVCSLLRLFTTARELEPKKRRAIVSGIVTGKSMVTKYVMRVRGIFGSWNVKLRACTSQQSEETRYLKVFKSNIFQSNVVKRIVRNPIHLSSARLPSLDIKKHRAGYLNGVLPVFNKTAFLVTFSLLNAFI